MVGLPGLSPRRPEDKMKTKCVDLISSSDHRCITKLICWAGLMGLHRVSLLASEERSD